MQNSLNIDSPEVCNEKLYIIGNVQHYTGRQARWRRQFCVLKVNEQLTHCVLTNTYPVQCSLENITIQTCTAADKYLCVLAYIANDVSSLEKRSPDARRRRVYWTTSKRQIIFSWQLVQLVPITRTSCLKKMANCVKQLNLDQRNAENLTSIRKLWTMSGRVCLLLLPTWRNSSADEEGFEGVVSDGDYLVFAKSSVWPNKYVSTASTKAFGLIVFMFQ